MRKKSVGTNLVNNVGLLEIAAPLAVAFIANAFAEWMLLTIENRIAIALAKSVKAIIIPSLIALYALIIANAIAGPNA